MHEFLPITVGIVIGWLIAFLPRFAWRSSALPILCIPAGALVSAVNGELTSIVWPLFVSFDAILVWAGATLALVASRWAFHRQPANSVQ